MPRLDLRATILLAALLAALLGVGCSAARFPRSTAPPSTAPPSIGRASPSGAAAAPSPIPLEGSLEMGGEPWEIPRAELGSQRLYRLRYQGPEGESGLRVTLRLMAPDRYRVSVVDPVGRSVWRLAVDGGGGVWVDDREERYCTFEGPLGLASVPLSPFPVETLPALLLGRLPSPPAGPVAREPRDDGAGEQVSYPEALGRRLTAVLAGAGEIASWTLWEGEEPRVWWMRSGEESLLSARPAGGERGTQIRWREVIRESAAGELPALEPPAGFRRDCGSPPPVGDP